MDTISENKCFGGTQGVYSHASAATGGTMTFGLFLPEEAANGPVPVLIYLSGLTCTHENAMTKSGAQAYAAEQGIALVFPDTSPRGDGVADTEGFDMGLAASFYVDATQDPWKPHYQMETYITRDLMQALADFPLDMDRVSITGHSMGGHGALTLALKHPDMFRSVSAFSPICHPTASDWGQRQFEGYLGSDKNAWAGHDATLLMRSKGYDKPVLVDQGTADQFYDKLNTGDFAAACADARADAQIRLQSGYDHSYFFIASFIADHVDFHARALYA
ncbi:S-formylglutathione hydrolase [Loktanella sp. 3ANDIMAR09]|uniref:S-formylglutathione hydrolase n=1 Tax=Loktanella sp. 3ANDIMAR09 TaxID=1225657 RepID=UPI0006F866D6|nr:S-formylglutathione hydrolase [Loktanella sp. 3ANDIMAR09]KQI68015.1 S-formylglutathione hydrolase [Loktanella sp. 3ANDIMAR09]